MGQSVGDSKTPVYIAFAMIGVGILLACVNGILSGSILGGVIAAAGAIPACFGMWKGIQQETQGTLALSVLAVLAALGIGALLIVLRIIHWVT